jgi:hypothetical protein
MNYRVTDLLKNYVDKNSKLILIHVTNKSINNLLELVGKTNNSKIYSYNYDKIYEILKENNIEPAEYTFLFYIFYNETVGFPKKLLLAHKSITSAPLSFMEVEKYGKGMIYKPVGKKNYDAFGLIYADTGIVKDKNINLIKNEYLTEINNTLNTNGVGTLNEFRTLNHRNHKNYEFLKYKFLEKSGKEFKLKDYDNRYITNLDDDLVLRDKNYERYQQIIYTSNGELNINNKCINMEDNGKLSLKKCENKIEQKWYPIDNNIVSEKNNQCISSINQELLVDDCSNLDRETKEWTFENISGFGVNDYQYPKNRGKRVVLVNSDNPWYVNKDITQIIPYMEYKDVEEAEKKIQIKENREQERIDENNELLIDQSNFDLHMMDPRYSKSAKFISKFNLDPTRQDMGYGYSYASRQGKKCDENIVEGFDYNYFNTQNIILFTTIVILIIFIVKYVNYKNK